MLKVRSCLGGIGGLLPMIGGRSKWLPGPNSPQMTNKDILEKANAAVTAGDYEGFLAFCTEDTHWTFVGDQVLEGKEAVRQYMATAYVEPPKFHVDRFISEGDYLTALGKISLKDEAGQLRHYSYCDVWRLRDGKLFELQAFVVEDRV